MVDKTVKMPIFQYIFEAICNNDYEKLNFLYNKFNSENFANDENGKVSLDCVNLFWSLWEQIDKVHLYSQSNSSLTENFIEKLKPCSACFKCQSCQVAFYKHLVNFFREEINNFCIYKEKIYPFLKLPEDIDEIIKSKVILNDLYGLYDLECSKKDIKNSLIMLKGMSSATPSILNYSLSTSDCRGGGIYLNINDIGFAIDPGYKFLENLHSNKISIFDINYIIVTHNHVDHQSDLVQLDDLIYSLRENERFKKVNLLVDSSTLNFIQALQKDNSGFSKLLYNIFCINDKLKIDEIKNNGVELEFFNTRHIEIQDGYRDNSFGVNFNYNIEGIKSKLTYTSDTAYSKDILEATINSNIIIANISSIQEKDFYSNDFHKYHLGFKGCKELLSKADDNLKMFILSEFWNGNSDLRFPVTKYLKELAPNKKDVIILPSEVGMTVNLKQKQVKCSNCGGFTSSPKIIRPKSILDEVKYFCENCWG